MSSIEFDVDEVERATSLLPVRDRADAIQDRIGHEPDLFQRFKPKNSKKEKTDRPFEAFFTPKDGKNCVGGGDMHGFLLAVHLAYTHHYPLTISPDDIWLCIVQAFATHVNNNAEALRFQFVQHEGKKEISVRRDDFIKGSPDNPWPEVFSEFSSKIREHIGNDTHDLLVPLFTTTGETEKAAAEIVMMEAFKKYFGYSVMTACGIPKVILRGTVDDWKLLRENTLKLAQFNLSDWISSLEPVLNELVATSEGNINKKFWSSIYKYSGESGGPYISGWITKLFPIGNAANVPSFCSQSDDFPSGISKAPFMWQYYSEEYKMNFYAGFMGVSQDPQTLSVSAEIGWVVGERKKMEQQKSLWID